MLAYSLQAPSFAATAPTDLQQGIDSYNASDHPRAISYFQAHLAKNQKDAVAHYYLANSLFKLDQVDAALVEYRKAYDLSPPGQLRTYCLTAIQKGEATRSQNPVAKTPSADEIAVSKALDRIKQQSDIVKSNKEQTSKANAKNLLGRGEYDGYKLQSERDAKIRALQQPDMIDIHGRAIYLDHSAEIEQLKRDYAARITEANRMAEQEAVAHKAAVAKDALKMDAEVQNLESQLTGTRSLPGTPALQATGTNFYTRQYGDPRAKKKEEPVQDELLATPEKMVVDPHAKSGSNKYRVVKDPLVAEQDKLDAITPGTNLKVKGRLIRK